MAVRAGILRLMTALLLWGCAASSPQHDASNGLDAGQPSGKAGMDAGSRRDGGGALGRAGTGGAAPGPGGAGGHEMASGAGGTGGTAIGRDAAVSDAGDMLGSDASVGHCLDGITHYADMGPFSFSSVQSGKVNIWVPDVPAGCKVPVVHFGNGTGAACSSYTPLFEHLASHGFLTACYEDPSPDDGTHCLAALHTLFSEYPDLADMKIGSTGHETGGAVAIACVQRAEQEWGSAATYAGHAMAPFFGTGSAPNWMAQLGQIESPIFLFSGSQDYLVSTSSLQPAFDALKTEKYWYEATGAMALPVPVSWAEESAVVFFRWKLLGDQAAGKYFAEMPNSDRWDLKAQMP